MADLCECGCGEAVVPGRRFRQGHWSRSQANRAMRETMRKPTEQPNPSGLCMCGCGQMTPVARTSKPQRGYRAGEHLRYIPGHQVGDGPENPNWKGGRWTHKGGYVYVYRPQHPAANRDGYVYEHRVVAEEAIGRLLEPWERVHHVNGIKTDNRPENLAVMESQGAHMRLHGTDGLQEFHKAHPEARKAAGKLGAQARIDTLRRRKEAAIVAILLDDELLERTRAYVRQHGHLPELD